MEQEDVIVQSQLIFLQRKRKKGNVDYHTVIQGETVYDISQAEGIRLENLLAYNFLKPGDQPKPGSILYLQENATAAPELIQDIKEKSTVILPSESPIKAVKVSHWVAVKETLYSISRKYDVSVDQLKDWNHLRNSELRVGQKLIIYKK
jgi:LysM repeat protein